MKTILLISFFFVTGLNAQTKDSSVNKAGIELQKAANCRFNSIASAAIGLTVVSFNPNKETIIFGAFCGIASGVFQFCAIVHEKNAGKILTAAK
jgi:hypothetical protein